MFGPLIPKSKLFAGNGRWARRRGVVTACLAVAAWALAAIVGCSSPQARYKVLSIFFDGVPRPDAVVTATAKNQEKAASAGTNHPTPSVHKPFAANDCAACHVGGEHGAISGTQTVIDSNVCMKCHERIPTQFPVMHAPVAAKACLFCHNPHESGLPHLLLTPPPQLCTQCHERSLLGRRPPEHMEPKSDCLACHMGHGGESKYFVRQGGGNAATRPVGALQEQGAMAGVDRSANRPSTRPAPASVSPTSQPVASVVHALMLADDVAGESTGPIVIGERKETQFFHIEPPQPVLEMRYFYENDKSDQSNGTSTHFTDHRIEEDASFKTTGYLIHPNLVDLKLSGLIGPRQEWFDTNGQSGYGHELVYNYDVNATILRKEDAPLTLYTRRDTGLITRQFGPSFDNTVDSSGAILDWRSKVVPTRVEVYHSDQDQKSLDGTEVFTLSENTANIHSDAHPTENQTVSLNYAVSQVEETNKSGGRGGTQANSFVTQDATLAHGVEFGGQRQNNLTSSISFFDETGDFPLERLRLDERLLMRHSPSLETRLQYTLDYQSSDLPGVGSVDQTQNAVVALLTHRLYKSLVTTGTVAFVDVDRTGNTGSTEYSGHLATDYHKIVPLGLLDVTAGYGYDQQNNSAQGTVTHIANQPRAFNDPLPIIIPGANIVPGSILVRDATGIIIYTAGLDYLIRTFQDRVEIERVIGGRILNGQSVLISYDLAPQPANTITNNTLTAGVRYDFKQGPLRGLGIYARYENLDQHISAARPALLVPNSVRDVTVGAEYRFWEIIAGAEQEWHDSNVAPYDVTRFLARLQHRIDRDSTLSFNANYSIFDYPDEHNHVNMLNLQGIVSHSFTTSLHGSLSVTYLNQHDQLFGSTQGLEGTAEVRWNYRQTTVFAQVRQAFLDTRAQNSMYQSAYLGVRREF